MKHNEESFKQEVSLLYNNEVEVVGRFKGLSKPLLVKDKYGVLQVPTAAYLLKYRPGIKAALNQTEYFMNQLRELYPEIAEQLTPMSEYVRMKEKMLFNTKFGIVSFAPDALMAGHAPTVRSAVDRKTYMYNQLRYLYADTDYDFEIQSTNRHEGRCTLICPIHGKVEIDNDHIFSGCGCPHCNVGWTKSNVLYIVKLTNELESFYKLGVSYKKKNGDLRRFKDYRGLGYEIEVLKIIEFDDYVQCVDKEFKLKQLIKHNLYQPIK